MPDQALDRFLAVRRHEAFLRRSWWLMLGAGVVAVAIYVFEIVSLPVDRIHLDFFVNLRFGGLVLATAVASVAVSLRVGHKWPAAVALAAMVPLWRMLLADGNYALWFATATDGWFLIAIVLLPLTALLTLAWPRPRPPLPEARLMPRA